MDLPSRAPRRAPASRSASSRRRSLPSRDLRAPSATASRSVAESPAHGLGARATGLRRADPRAAGGADGGRIGEVVALLEGVAHGLELSPHVVGEAVLLEDDG